MNWVRCQFDCWIASHEPRSTRQSHVVRRLAISRRELSLILLQVCLALAGTLHAQTTLIPYGATWKYLDNGTDQGTAWRGVGFNDSGWASGPAQLGYGDGDEATVVSYGPSSSSKYATTYYRTTLNVPDPAQFASLSLTLLHDDAGAVFINGTEVARTANLPVGATFATYATSTSADNATQTWSVSPSVLIAGTNTIAVEIHQQSGSSSDVSFDLQLTAVGQVTRGPYLQMNNASGVTVRWRTVSATDSVVWTGTEQGALTSITAIATSGTEHEVRVSGLQPDTKYYYAVGSTSGPLAGGNANHFFNTAPSPGIDRAMHIWVLGDAGTAGNTSGTGQFAVRDAYYASPYFAFNDLVLLLGDNAYNTGLDSEFQKAQFDMYPTVLRQSPLWSCLGNHETAQDTDGVYDDPYFDIFTFPANAECGGYVSGTERYFSWDFGNVHFISLDAQTTDSTLRANMLTWLDNDLNSYLVANPRRWIIALWHHPPYTKGSHNSDTEEQLIWAREHLVPLLEDAGVDLVLSGHSHSYERSRFLDGFTATPTLATSGTFIDAGNDGVYGKDYGGHRGAVYTVAGSSGQTSGGALNHPVMFTSLNELGSVILDISGNRLDAKFINSSGAVQDSFTLEKGPIVTVSTQVPDAAEYGPVTGQFSVARSGSTASPLVVQASVGGSAPGSRYAAITVPVTIPSGSSSVTLSVTPQPDSVTQGAQSVTLTSSSNVAYRLGASTSGTVTITDTPAGEPPIASWHLAKFGATANNEAIRGDNIDPDLDGIVNLIEYALGLEPLFASTAGLPIANGTGAYLTLSVPKNPGAIDVSFSVQVNGDLTNAAGWSAAGTTILQNTATRLEVRDNVPISGANHRFMRLQVTRP